MYTSTEIKKLCDDCQNEEELMFLCDWLRILILTGVQERLPEIRTYPLMRFGQLFNNDNI